jgi:hypothetical protein
MQTIEYQQCLKCHGLINRKKDQCLGLLLHTNCYAMGKKHLKMRELPYHTEQIIEEHYTRRNKLQGL